MVSYKIVLGIEENMDTRNIECFHMKSLHLRFGFESKPSNTQNAFLVKIILFRGLGVEQDFQCPKALNVFL